MALKQQENPKLEMTPMIDVVFELLIFFVVTIKQEDLFTKLNRLRKNYTAIMDKATQYIGRGADSVTIYLYSKNGVVISPHEVGYVAASPSPNATMFVPAQRNPDEPSVTPAPNNTPDPDATPGPDTPPPFNQGGFTG